MSNVSVRVELPGHSHSFLVEVLDTSSVRSIKAEIAKTCPGGPRVEGQRLIYRGRILKDEEKIQDIWTSPQDSLTVHLAVHPSAWTTSPPDRQVPTPTSSNFSYIPFSGVPTPTSQSPPPSFSPPPPTTFSTSSGHHYTSQYHTSTFASPFGPIHHPHPFIAYKHDCAIAALITNTYVNIPPSFLEVSRRSAVLDLQKYGWTWPSIFDEPIPAPDGSEGLKYERLVIEGQPYLSLATPSAKPTALQLHALKTLSYTFSIISMPPPTPVAYNVYYPYSPSTPYPMPPAGAQNLNARLQDLGLPALRVAQNGMGVQIRAIPLRALLVPFIMLIIRTLLLVYFFAPSKTPFFGLILGAWITYEAWNAFRIALRPARAGGEQRAAPPAQGANGAVPQANPQTQQAGAPGAASTQPRDHSSVILDTLANINLSFENEVLSATTPGMASEPSLAHKAQTFVTLLITTVHPALWNRRRTELMRREGRVRTEAAAMQLSDGDVNVTHGGVVDSDRQAAARMELRAQHARRPVWVKEYVDRVRNAEFAEE